MGSVGWTPKARDDLEAICRYIARDSPRLAESFGERIVDAVDRLADLPRSGRIVPEFQRQDIREVIVGRYRIVYALERHDVRILTVWHGSRLLRPGDVA
jgi:toxin ParE1/3/4